MCGSVFLPDVWSQQHISHTETTLERVCNRTHSEHGVITSRMPTLIIESAQISKLRNSVQISKIKNTKIGLLNRNVNFFNVNEQSGQGHI